VMTLLFNENVVTYEEALSRGAKGLVQLPGIGPKKAEALMELAEAHVAKVATQEPTEEETSEASEPAEAAPEIVEGESETDEPVEEEDVAGEGEEDEEEEEEIPVQELKGVTPEVLETLISNGFETLAELSVTPLVELLAMEGIDEEVGQSILEQVKQRLENLENV